MRLIPDWPGSWSNVAPSIDDHLANESLAWVVRGYPFNFPVLAESSIGIINISSGSYKKFIRIEINADGIYGVQASNYPWYNNLEWLGPIKISM